MGTSTLTARIEDELSQKIDKAKGDRSRQQFFIYFLNKYIDSEIQNSPDKALQDEKKSGAGNVVYNDKDFRKVLNIIGDMARYFAECPTPNIQEKASAITDNNEVIQNIKEGKDTGTILDAISKVNRKWISSVEVSDARAEILKRYLNYLLSGDKDFFVSLDNIQNEDVKKAARILKKLIGWKHGQPEVYGEDFKYLGTTYPEKAKLRLTKDSIINNYNLQKKYEGAKLFRGLAITIIILFVLGFTGSLIFHPFSGHSSQPNMKKGNAAANAVKNQ